MKDPFRTWLLRTCAATPSATSSQALQGGPTQHALPDGLTRDRSGQDHAPASHSQSRGKAKARKTSATSGQSSSASSTPAAPLSSWESRLRQRLASIGSTECSLIWKASDTPAGRRLFRLVPSMRPTAEIDCGLWRTPNHRDGKGAYTDPQAFQRRMENGHQLNLNDEVRMAMWATPSARDWKDTPGMATTAVDPDGSTRSRVDQLPRQVAAAMWSTPRASDGEKGGPNQSFGAGGQPLPAQAYHVAMWPTPTHRDHFPPHSAEYIAEKKAQGHGMANLSDIGPLGMAPAGSSATTEKPGALNPAFVFWLMGFPPEWESCAPQAMPSSRKSRQK